MSQQVARPSGPASPTTAGSDHLLLACSKRLLAYAARQIRRSGPGLEAEDLVQAAYFEAFRCTTRPECGNADAAFGWLATIVRHQVANALKAGAAAKRGGGRAAVSMPSGDDPLMDGMRARQAVDQRSALQSAIAREDSAALELAISGLPPDQEQVIRLHFIDCMSIKEVARHLRRTQMAVHARCNRALKALRDDMGAMPGFALTSGRTQVRAGDDAPRGDPIHRSVTHAQGRGNAAMRACTAGDVNRGPVQTPRPF